MTDVASEVLVLGCGNRPLSSTPDMHVINHDRTAHRPDVMVVHDLDVLPWPWEDNSQDLIVARAVLEHLKITLIQSMDECWRILRPGGQIAIKLPYWQHDNSYSDPTHYWQFSLETLTLFDPATSYGKRYSFYTTQKWRIIQAPRLNGAKSSIHARLEVRKP